MPNKRKRASTLTSQTADDASAPTPAPAKTSGAPQDAPDASISESKTEAEAAPAVKADASLPSLSSSSSLSSDPPAKRTRSSKDAAPKTENGLQKHDSDHSLASQRHDDDSNNDNDDDSGNDAYGGENGEAGTMKMEPPPRAGLVHPVGYLTNPPPTDRPVRVYADGVFDLFHLGHMRQLQQAKTAFPNTYLLVGVTGDKETHRRKGLTVLSGKERAETVRHCKWVDEVIEDCPWIVSVDFLEKHQIDYVAHDDIPYGADEGDDIYKPVKEKGMFLVTQRTEGVSTTGIITKIVRDYEAYIARQLKRGTSRQELNISWLKKNELDIKRHVGELRDTIKTNWTTTGQELGKELRQFWQPSRQNSPARSVLDARSSFETPRTRLSRLEVPGSARSSEMGGGSGRNSDFAAGYAMGLLGSVRSWMQRSRRNLNDSTPQSPMSEDDSPLVKSPSEPERGRKGRASASSDKPAQHDADAAAIATEMDTK